jgi:hypothetical protein
MAYYKLFRYLNALVILVSLHKVENILQNKSIKIIKILYYLQSAIESWTEEISAML